MLREEAAQHRSGGLYGFGLAQLGLDPDRLVLGVLPDAVSLLGAAAEVARCPGVGGAVIELLRRLPVAALGLDPESELALKRAGLKTIADLAERPVAPLAARFR